MELKTMRKDMAMKKIEQPQRDMPSVTLCPTPPSEGQRIGEAVGKIAAILAEALASMDDYSGKRLLRMVRGMTVADTKFLCDEEE